MSDKNPKTVLVVDDDAEIRKLVAAMLTGKGYRVLIADSGENAIRQWTKHPETDLLLTDVVIPGMSGPIIADRILELSPDIKVLFMTGYHDTQVVQRFVVDKGYSLLIKPFTLAQLGALIQAALAGEEAQPALRARRSPSSDPADLS
jgi:two-component system, cell cycle sensor histidine kinase and response regulator CckA